MKETKKFKEIRYLVNSADQEILSELLASISGTHGGDRSRTELVKAIRRIEAGYRLVDGDTVTHATVRYCGGRWFADVHVEVSPAKTHRAAA